MKPFATPPASDRKFGRCSQLFPVRWCPARPVASEDGRMSEILLAFPNICDRIESGCESERRSCAVLQSRKPAPEAQPMHIPAGRHIQAAMNVRARATGCGRSVALRTPVRALQRPVRNGSAGQNLLEGQKPRACLLMEDGDNGRDCIVRAVRVAAPDARLTFSHFGSP